MYNFSITHNNLIADYNILFSSRAGIKMITEAITSNCIIRKLIT